MKPLRILVAVDHDAVREDLGLLLERQPGWRVCGVTGSGREAVAPARTLRPDVVILDIGMPDTHGLAAARQIRRDNPAVELLIFTAHETDETIREIFESGIKAYIGKFDAATHLVEAVKAVSEHRLYFTDAVWEVLFRGFLDGDQKGSPLLPDEPLSSREREIVRLLAEGKINKEVADILGLSVRTVEKHRANIMARSDVGSIAGLVRYAVRHGLIEP